MIAKGGGGVVMFNAFRSLFKNMSEQYGHNRKMFL
jgi:hypothetical protein